MGPSYFCCRVTIEHWVMQVSFVGDEFGSGRHMVQSHSHSCYELHGVTGSGGSMTVDGEKLSLEENTCCIIGPEVYHSGYKPQREGGKHYCLQVEPICKKSGQWIPGWQGAWKLLEDGRRWLTVFGEIERELRSPSLGSQAAIEGMAAYCAVWTMRAVALGGGEVRRARAHPEETVRPMEIDAFFANHGGENVHTEALAEQLCVSVRQLDRILHKIYGKSFRSKLREMRVLAAKERLRSSDATIQAIAAEVGYQNVGYFSRAFQAETGLTPTAYRKGKRSGI